MLIKTAPDVPPAEITPRAVYLRRRELLASVGGMLAALASPFAEDAAAWEPVASSGAVEYGRKVRVMTRGLRGVVLRRSLLDPRRTGFYALQLFWHKVARRLAVLPLIGLGLSSPILAASGGLYRLAAAGQAAFYALAALGFATRGVVARPCPGP